MGLWKFAAFDIEAAELVPGASMEMQLQAVASVAQHPGVSAYSQQSTGLVGFSKQAHRHAFAYDPRPGFLYVRSRAISSRINDNFDGFPAEEIKKAYRTFVGKPVFVNHHNANHRRARGVIIDAALHEDVAPDGSPDTWVEVLMEVDAVRFPKLAQAILAGHIDRTSMGTDVAYSICTFCGNKAASPLDYCSHIPKLKGKRIQRTTASGDKESVLVAEMCYGLGFFENSLLVEPPADPTAFAYGVDARGLGVTAAQKTAMPSGDSIETVIAWARQNAERAGTASVSRLSGTDVLALCDFIGDDANETVKWARQNAERADGASVSRVSGTDILKLCDMAEAKLGTTASRRTAARQVPVEKLAEGDVVNMGGSWGQWNVTGTEPIEQYDVLGNKGVRVFFAEHPQGMGFKVGDTLSVVKPGRRGLTDQQMAERTPPNTSPMRAQCPVCDKTVAWPADGQRIRAHNWGNTSSPCPASGLTVPEADAYREEERRKDYDRQRWASQAPTVKVRPDQRVATTEITRYPSEFDLLMHHHGLGEMKAPPKVDTMRDSKCPVCGEEEGFNGEECVVCQFVKPPDMFMDPDTSVAGEVDLRQEQQDALQNAEDATGTGDLVCDNCGTEFDDPDAQDADNEGKELPDPEELPEDTPPVQKDVPPGSPYKPEESPGNMKSDRPSPDNANDVDNDGETKDDLGKDPEEKKLPNDPDDEVDEDAQDPETVQPKAGDTCPDCGKGKLQKKSPAPEAPAEDQEAPKPEGDGSKKPEDDDDKKKSAPPWAKKSSHPGSAGPKGESTAMAPRPFHVVAAEQQASIDYAVQVVDRIASLAGVDVTDLQHQRQQRVARIRRVALEDPQVNPAQPPGFAVAPQPAAEAPAQTTQEAKTPTATDDVTQPGATPLVNVAPDAQVGLADSGPVLSAPLDLNEQDVTAPVAGTTEVRPASETRTETEIRTGTPSDTGTAFPLQGDFAQKATASAPQAPTPMEQAQARFFAGNRLANLRVQAGISQEDPTVLAQRIATDQSITDGAIMAEIETLTQVVATRGNQQQQQPQRTAAATARRTVPSMVPTTTGMPPVEANLDPALGGLARPTDDEFLFE